MGIIKDWHTNNSGDSFGYRILYVFSPKEWLRLHKWRKQRANRGWSDKDTWDAGDYIAKITAEMLQHLNDHAYTDWLVWFETHTGGKGTYSNLQSVIDDIDNYLKFEIESWADGLKLVQDDTKKIFEKDDKGEFAFTGFWVDMKTGKKLTDKQIGSRVKKYSEQEHKLYKKATEAMQFFGRHFSSFWD